MISKFNTVFASQVIRLATIPVMVRRAVKMCSVAPNEFVFCSSIIQTNPNALKPEPGSDIYNKFHFFPTFYANKISFQS